MTDAKSPQARKTILLTPGPLTTSDATRAAMTRDWGSRDADFIDLTARVRKRLEAICNAAPSHTCVPIQGSGTFAVEAMIGTLVPKEGRLLVACNGAYGQRIAAIAARLGRAVFKVEGPEDRPTDLVRLEQAIADHQPTHLAAVHCETTSGVRNPIDDIAALARREKISLLIDAMSSFGALPLDCDALGCAAIAASANKCLEGAPGLAFVIARTSDLERSKGQAPSVSLDLHDQWRGLQANGQWRFTPPTHVLAALDSALEQFIAAGGQVARLARYSENCNTLISGMRAAGFETFLRDEDQAPIIVTFRVPNDPAFSFDAFYDALREIGVVIYPGKITDAETFRIGCIGAIGKSDMSYALDAVSAVLNKLGLRSGGSAC